MATLEADDVLGILATKPENKGKAIIVSDDKDMKSIPAKLYRPMSDERFDITEAEADKAFLMQCLCGDPTDGYSGLKGFGPKSSEKLLGSRPDWSLVENAFIKAGHTKEEALTQARLARILRWSDWDFENKKPILFGSKEYVQKTRPVHEGKAQGATAA
jgi:DNA polymerase-1